MIKSKKTTKIIILCIAITMTIVAISGLSTYLKKDSKYYAEQFLGKVTTPEDEESTIYYRDMFSGKTSNGTFEDYADSLKKDYGELMTGKAFDKAVANRFIPWDILVEEDSNYKIEVDSYEVKKMQDYEDGRVYYGYLISLRVLLSNGEYEAVQVSGDIVMTEDNGTWIVDVFRWNSDYKQIYEMLGLFSVCASNNIGEFI